MLANELPSPLVADDAKPLIAHLRLKSRDAATATSLHVLAKLDGQTIDQAIGVIFDV